jgi:hypothetical protein
MASKVTFSIDIVESLDEQKLERLEETLGLQWGGRLDDDWDYEFGSRRLKDSAGQVTEVALWRADDEPWYVQVTHPEAHPPDAEEIAGWRKEIIDGIKAAGLTPDPSE